MGAASDASGGSQGPHDAELFGAYGTVMEELRARAPAVEEFDLLGDDLVAGAPLAGVGLPRG